MRRWYVLVPTAALLVVLVGVVAAWLTAPRVLRPRLEAALTRALGHQARIGTLHLSPTLDRLVLADLRVAAPPGFTDPDLLRVPRVEVSLSPARLLAGVVAIDRVEAVDPMVSLERDAAGRLNWTAGLAEKRLAERQESPEQGQSTALKPGGRDRLALGRIEVTGGAVMIRDPGRSVAELAHWRGYADLSRPPAAEVRFDISAAQGSGHLAGTIDRGDPLGASVLSAEAQAVFEGAPSSLTARLQPGLRADGQFALRASGQDIRGTWHSGGLGHLPVPLTINVAWAGGTASVSGQVTALGEHAAGDGTLAVRVADLATISGLAGRRLPSGPASLQVRVSGDAMRLSLGDLMLTSPPLDARGSLQLGAGPIPSVAGNLASSRLDLDALLAALAPSPVAPATAPTSAPVLAPVPAAVPATPVLPFARLEGHAADVTLSVASLSFGGETYQDVSAHVLLRDGRLAVDPLAGRSAAGKVSGTVHADARATPPSLALALNAPAVAVAPVLGLLLDRPVGASGSAAIQADLRAAGATRNELLRSLSGTAGLRLVDGEVDNALFAMLAAARLPLDLSGRSRVRCLAGTAAIDHGIAVVTLLADTTRVLLQGSGQVDLPGRSLALRLRPLLRTGPGLVVPVLLTGPWNRPRVDVGERDLAAGLLGSLGRPSQGDACAAAGLRPAAAPPAPSGPAKLPKPADLLRRFLR